MNKLKKKLLGALGLLAVVTMTFVAATLPSGSAHAIGASIPVTVNVDNPGQFSAGFTSPADESEKTNNSGTLGVIYSDAKTITVTISGPDGSTETIFSGPVAESSSSFDAPYGLTHGFGDYTFTVSGTDLSGNPQDGSSITIHYHSAFSDILPDPDENGDPTVRVTYGPEVCGVRFKIISVDDPSRAPTYYPSLQEPPINCQTEDKNNDGIFDIIIPMSSLDLDIGKYQIFVTTYGCTAEGDPDTGNIIEDNLPAGSFIFDPKNEYIPEVPGTGSVRIGGLVVAQKDLILTGIISLVAVAGIYYAKKNKQQIKK
ncbi:hypothetical protein LJC07_06395 [Christensenellaceae bacterium OttesenSCG-928-L17]|nr:hypothetical protein [Christensenellaceae bacterium OttesenSCG-928-L17]